MVNVNSKNQHSFEPLLDPKEIGEIIGLRRSKIHRMLASGEIPAVIVAQGACRRVYRVRPSALQKWLADREVKNGR